MPRIELPFIGGSYTGFSGPLNCQRSINWYPIIDKQHGKLSIENAVESIGSVNSAPVIALYPTPGLDLVKNLDYDFPVRQQYIWNGLLYVICGDTLFEVDGNYNKTAKGTIETTTGYVYMVDNGLQLAICDKKDGYIFDGTTLTKVAAIGAVNPGSLIYIDGYFMINEMGSQRIWYSALLDGTSWPGANTFSAEGSPDNVIALLASHKQVWAFGEKTTEVFYNTGATTDPFESIPGVYIERGIGAADSCVNLDNSVFWLDNYGMLQRSINYGPQTISTRQVEYQFGTYSNLSNAIAFGYVKEGHSFYNITFPTDDRTWSYDVATDFWHERTSAQSGEGRWRSNCYVLNGRDHLVGDYQVGKLYKLNENTFTENGNLIQRERITQAVHGKGRSLSFPYVQIDFESGVGLDGDVQGSDPKAMLSWSDNGGKTWSNTYTRSIGKIGKYETMAIWTQTGMAYSRNWRLRTTDPIKAVVIGAYADVDIGVD